MSGKRDHIGSEFFESLVTRWAEKLWALNNADKPQKESEREFRAKWYPDNDRGLTKRQSASEQGFVLFAYALTYTVGVVSEKAADKISDSKLVDAWRKAVLRNGFQQRYTLFEEILQDTIKKHGEAAAIAAFDAPKDIAASEITGAIDHYRYKAKFMDQDKVKELITKAVGLSGTAPAAAAPKAP